MLIAVVIPSDPLVDALARCLEVADPRSRLACLDRDARALVDASRTTPRANRPGDGRPAPIPVVEAVDSTLKTASARGGDRWLLVLADGSRWETTEAWLVTRTLKPGMAVSIRRAALSSYVLRLAGERSTRVRRIG